MPKESDKTYLPPTFVRNSEEGRFEFFIDNHIIASFQTMAQCDALTFAYFEVMGGPAPIAIKSCPKKVGILVYSYATLLLAFDDTEGMVLEVKVTREMNSATKDHKYSE